MIKRKPRYSKEEIARRGRALYAKHVRPKVGREKKGRVVAIDINTGDFEVADDTLPAAHQLLARRPDAEIWLARVGYRTFHRIGSWHASERSR